MIIGTIDSLNTIGNIYDFDDIFFWTREFTKNLNSWEGMQATVSKAFLYNGADCPTKYSLLVLKMDLAVGFLWSAFLPKDLD